MNPPKYEKWKVKKWERVGNAYGEPAATVARLDSQASGSHNKADPIPGAGTGTTGGGGVTREKPPTNCRGEVESGRSLGVKNRKRLRDNDDGVKVDRDLDDKAE